MTRPGPKPSAGERYPSGKLKACANRAGSAPAAVRRLVDAALRGATDPRWGTTIGRMLLEGAITSKQFGAAEAYARLRGQFDKSMGLPRRSARSIIVDETGCFTPTRELDEHALAQLRTDHGRLIADIGPLRALLDRVLLDDEAPGPGELPRLKAGLDAMAVLFRIGVP